MKISGVTGNEITVAPQGSIAPDGNYSFAVYETAAVTSVSGSAVNYSASLPVPNIDASQHAPISAAWNYGDQGLINDVTVRRNTLYVDPAFAHDVFVHKGYIPKGAFEIKNVNRLVYESNYNLGYPANWAITPRNQNGTAPWITTSHLILRNNWMAADTGYRVPGRMAGIALQDNEHTSTPATDIQIYNNFAKNIANMIVSKGGDGWLVKHNTIINDLPTVEGYHVVVVLEGVPSTNWTFRDNIIGYSSYGMSCSIPPGSLATCWPNGTFQNNVVVDFVKGGIDIRTWGVGGILPLILKSFAQFGFVDASKDNYRLAASSPYKGKASDGSDPGVDMDVLMTALAGGSNQAVENADFEARLLFSQRDVSKDQFTGINWACTQQASLKN